MPVIEFSHEPVNSPRPLALHVAGNERAQTRREDGVQHAKADRHACLPVGGLAVPEEGEELIFKPVASQDSVQWENGTT